LNNALGRDVPIGIAVKNKDAAAAGISHDNFVVPLVDCDGVRPDHLCLRALDYANGSLGSIRAATKHQHGIRERYGHDYFVM
jgi:hypothetical protein